MLVSEQSACVPPFATVDDLEQRWHTLTSEEQVKANALLSDASDLIVSLCPDWQEINETTLRRITCQVVKRAMLATNSGVPDGVTQMNSTTGSFSDGYTFANPTGDLYLVDAERKSLGIGKARAFTISLAGEHAESN